jgi:hypothetical protein
MLLKQLLEATKQSLFKVQQELVDALPNKLNVELVHEKYFDRYYLRVSNERQLSIRVEWPGEQMKFTITREYETGDSRYPEIRSIKELVMILTNELEHG